MSRPSAAWIVALRLGLGVLFLWAGATKLVDPESFGEEIANYHLLPALAPWLAATLPAIEILVALVLAIGPSLWRAAAAWLALALLLVFTGAVASVWLRGIDVRCGCFGKGGGPIDALTVARDLGFVAWAALVSLLGRSPAPNG